MTQFHDFEVTLVDVLPRTWRRFLLKKTARKTLVTLHEAIHDAAGWEYAHLFAFHTSDGELLANGFEDEFDDTQAPLAKTMKLSTVCKGPARLLYNYDFGDDWWVDVVHHGIVERPGDEQRVLVDGSGLWAPDDCGGVGGFADLQAVLKKAASGKRLSADEKEHLEWAGGAVTFDIDVLRRRFHVNRAGTTRSVA